MIHCAYEAMLPDAAEELELQAEDVDTRCHRNSTYRHKKVARIREREKRKCGGRMEGRGSEGEERK